VNKADRDGADATYRDIQGMIALGGSDRAPGDWRPRVLKVSAARAEGIDSLVEAIDEHHDWLDRTGELMRRRQKRAAAEVEALVLAQLRARFAEIPGVGLNELAAEVAAGRLDPYAAATRLLEEVA
jgi:GTPase